MICNSRHFYVLCYQWVGYLLIAISVVFSASVAADSRTQAKRMHDRLSGTIATNTMLTNMLAVMDGSVAGDIAAAKIAINNNSSFYNVTLKNFAAPWTNEDQTVFVPLNDYTATVIGMIRDDVDFRQVLSGNIIYTGTVDGTDVTAAYSNTDNIHYEQLERTDLKTTLRNPADVQSSVTGLPAVATAGIMTSRAAAEAFFSDGTNRAMFRFTFMNHLCTDLEPLKDVSRVPDYVRRDVTRSPGGDSRIFMNSCVGCHAGMDGMMGAFAYYDFTNQLVYQTNNDDIPNPDGDDFVNPNHVVNKFNHNESNFKYGHIVFDDSWVNYWRNGQNSLLGWDDSVTLDDNDHSTGNGAKSLGVELANTHAFASCQVKKAFKAVCLRNSDDYAADRSQVQTIVAEFKVDTYNMKNVFARVAAYCKGP